MTITTYGIDIKNRAIPLIGAMAMVIGFAFLTGIAANIRIDIGAVPITMQTLVVLLSGAILGSKKGALSQIAYLLMGLGGVFWFARGGGPLYLLSPTFGYILGFILSSFVVGLICERGYKLPIALAAGTLLVYVPGLLWLSAFVGVGNVLAIGFYPFILGDALKIVLAVVMLSSGMGAVLESGERSAGA